MCQRSDDECFGGWGGVGRKDGVYLVNRKISKIARCISA